jgi:hypothetical protein
MRKSPGTDLFTLILSLLWSLVLTSAGCRPLAKVPVETANPPAILVPPQVVIIQPLATPTIPLATSTPPVLQPISTPTMALPKEHYIRNINGHRQYFPLGCEAAAAKDWANYIGKDFNELKYFGV